MSRSSFYAMVLLYLVCIPVDASVLMPGTRLLSSEHNASVYAELPQEVRESIASGQVNRVDSASVDAIEVSAIDLAAKIAKIPTTSRSSTVCDRLRRLDNTYASAAALAVRVPGSSDCIPVAYGEKCRTAECSQLSNGLKYCWLSCSTNRVINTTFKYSGLTIAGNIVLVTGRAGFTCTVVNRSSYCLVK